MNQKFTPIYIGETRLHQSGRTITGDYIDISGEAFYRIKNYDQMPPFFISLVSSSNHWIFISSNGGLTAGRVNADQALFPYYNEDKITENAENTGSKTIMVVERDQRVWLWEPFSIRQQGLYDIQHNLYKNIPGTALTFEACNFNLNLIFRYTWRTGDRFGFIKTSSIRNLGSTCSIELLDGIQNILPANTTELTQNTFSVLLDAYKRCELNTETGLAMYTLNSKLTDLAEPSESLLATTVFQVGLDHADYLLSSSQLDQFRAGNELTLETETRGKRGAFFVHSKAQLDKDSEISWHIAADVNQDCADIINKINCINAGHASLIQLLEADINENNARMEKIVASADGLQISANPLYTSHHFANVMFNVMRGGYFPNQYWIDKPDFINYLSTHNKALINDQAELLDTLPDKMHITALYEQANASGSTDLIRLSYSYLPLTFSRRHGDPSRPWNRFAINIQNEDGSERLDYEGNWRDIFQNWEALALSYPEYIEGMICTFLNATTVDGYNPYRITRRGIEWEIPDPSNPWANIGYWSDHQIIYLLKLMELSLKVHPGKLNAMLAQDIFSYSNVPYRIKTYADLIKDPYDSITFDDDLNTEIETHVKDFGTDGRLVCDKMEQVIHRSLTEKLLTLLLAKLVNFVPEGGIWMNTQRPEWNDANNALVGKGLSVVTLGYLYRFTTFFRKLIDNGGFSSFQVSVEVSDFFRQVDSILKQFERKFDNAMNDRQRRTIMDGFGQAGSKYREDLYNNGLSGESASISINELDEFLERVEQIIFHSLRANQREDDLYHAYNVLDLGEDTAAIDHLNEMLEGQVSILSSGFLSGAESLTLLESLRNSRMYRADQNTYILYPDKSLPGFLEKNSVPEEKVKSLRLPALLSEKKNKSLLIKDENGDFHFSGSLHNEKDVRQALETLRRQPEFSSLVEAEGEQIADLFESIFKHSEFTGRSGTFFAYEGLGSIYWHMVSKLLLAVQEAIFRYQDEPITPALIEKYRSIRSGLGFNKTPAEYGAFPTDPYSHTPKGGGAKQPGMTGLVKEEILTRQAEVGLTIEDGCLVFNPLLIDRDELLTESSVFTFLDSAGRQRDLELPSGTLAYTFCQTPIIMQAGDKAEIKVDFDDSSKQTIPGYRLDRSISRQLFQRDGRIDRVLVKYQPK